MQVFHLPVYSEQVWNLSPRGAVGHEKHVWPQRHDGLLVKPPNEQHTTKSQSKLNWELVQLWDEPTLF